MTTLHSIQSTSLEMCSMYCTDSVILPTEMETRTVMTEENDEYSTTSQCSQLTNTEVKSTKCHKFYRKIRHYSPRYSPVTPVWGPQETPMIRRRVKPKRLILEFKKLICQKRYVCNFCDRLFKSKECLVSHHGVHGIVYWKSPYPWMDGDEQSNDGVEAVDGEFDQESSCDEEFTCQVCDIVFATEDGLSIHIDIHRREYQISSECSSTTQEYISEGH